MPHKPDSDIPDPALSKGLIFLALVFCRRFERATSAPFAYTDLRGMFDRVDLPALPGRLETEAFAYVAVRGGRKPMTIEAILWDLSSIDGPARQMTEPWRVEIEASMSVQDVREFVIPLGLLTFPDPGEYRLQISAEGLLCTERSMIVETRNPS